MLKAAGNSPKSKVMMFACVLIIITTTKATETLLTFLKDIVELGFGSRREATLRQKSQTETRVQTGQARFCKTPTVTIVPRPQLTV
jgi:hypothetical protein